MDKSTLKFWEKIEEETAKASTWRYTTPDPSQDFVKIIDLKENMIVRLPYEIEIHTGMKCDCIGLDDKGQLHFMNSQSYYVKDKKGKWYRPFAKKN